MSPLSALAKVAKDRGAAVICDNTWGPGIFKPFDMGADVSLNAATKYIGGRPRPLPMLSNVGL